MQNKENIVQEKSPLGKFISVTLPIIAIGCGIVLTIWLVNTKPQAKKRPAIKNNLTVEAQPIKFSNHDISVSAMGQVSAARDITLSAEVSGLILSMDKNMYPGGYFAKGDNMVQIDKSDYLIAVAQAQTNVTSAKTELAIEAGNQLVAEKEFELLGENVSKQEHDLMLRKPQLEQLKSSLKATTSSLDLAKKNLSRTTITAPFNGMIENLSTNIGSLVGGGSGLAQYVGTDTFWLELLVPVSDLKWITFAEGDKAGSEVKISNDSAWPAGSFRIGHVMRQSASLEEDGRLAKITVSISDPLSLQNENKDKPKLLIGSYVKAEIASGTLDNIVSINRKYIHDGNKIWLMTKEGSLEVREITPIFKDQDQYFIKDNLIEDEMLITSTIAAPIEGMLVKLAGDKSAPKEKKSKKNRDGNNE